VPHLIGIRSVDSKLLHADRRMDMNFPVYIHFVPSVQSNSLSAPIIRVWDNHLSQTE